MEDIDIEEVYKRVSDKNKEDTEKVTVTEFVKFLNKLIEAGYGDYVMTADTQDGSEYNVRNSVLVCDEIKSVRID